MLISNTNIPENIMRLSRHYNDNISTRFLRPVFTKILSDLELSHSLSDLTEHSEDFVVQGLHLEDLYPQILSMANFIFLVRRDILPNLHNLTDSNTRAATADRVYRKMAFSSLPTNINILSEMLEAIYDEAIKFDKATCTRGKLVASKFPKLSRFKDMLHA
ncbi:MAG: hypothetical protein CR988_06660 [Treponema sp.]|nr:MAG: hypothetical protein CR988_06660 [Treponema sp.]